MIQPQKAKNTVPAINTDQANGRRTPASTRAARSIAKATIGKTSNVMAAFRSAQLGAQNVVGLYGRVYLRRRREAPQIDATADLDDRSHFRTAIEKALKGAAGEAYRNLVRPKAASSVADAAYHVMEAAYLAASDNDPGPRLPAKARQIMYQARPQILELTGLKKFSDKYFTQTLLPDYLQSFPDETADWDVVYDARGNLSEPHTGRTVPLGTIEVRTYLGLRPNKPKRPQLATNGLYSTVGPLLG